jgi:tetratricopeptide (TPR) repeat protein
MRKSIRWVSLVLLAVVVIAFAVRLTMTEGNVLSRATRDGHRFDLGGSIASCDQRFALNPSSPRCQIDSVVDSRDQAAIDVIWEVWKGRTAPARGLIGAAPNGSGSFNTSAHLRYFVAVATENYSELRRLREDITRQSGASTDSGLSQLAAEVELHLAGLEGDWDNVQAILRKVPDDVVRGSPALFAFRAQSLEAKGDLSALDRELASVGAGVASTYEYALIRANRAWHAGGSDAWLESMRSQHERSPSDAYLELKLRLYEVLFGDLAEKSLARRRIQALAESRPTDVRFLYRAAVPLILYREPQLAAQLGDMIVKAAPDHQEFVQQRVFEAGMSAFAGEYSLAAEGLRSALSISPEHYWANYFNVLTARRLGDESSAYDSLVRLLRVHPQNPNLHALVDHFSSNFADVKWTALKEQYAAYRRNPSN